MMYENDIIWDMNKINTWDDDYVISMDQYESMNYNNDVCLFV